jgi:energy-coupling factor transporter ATP-binding protein EcfA2
MLKKKLIKELGQMTQLNVDIDQPMKLKIDLDMNALNLYLGKNGSGKSLILKMTWALATIMVFKINRTKTTEEEMLQIAQYVWDNTFEDNNFNGLVGALHPGGTISIGFKDGKIGSLLINVAESIVDAPSPLFLSVTMRTFDEVERFFKLQDKIGVDAMPEYYRLYDSVYAHKLKQAFEKGITVTKEIEDMLTKFELERYDIKSFGYKNDKFIYTNSLGEEKFISALSKGEQSLLNMKLGTM